MVFIFYIFVQCKTQLFLSKIERLRQLLVVYLELLRFEILMHHFQIHVDGVSLKTRLNKRLKTLEQIVRVEMNIYCQNILYKIEFFSKAFVLRLQ